MSERADCTLPDGARTVEIRRVVHPDGTVLVPAGELVYGSTLALVDALAHVPEDTPRIVLDMTDVTFMDTAGLHFLDCLYDYGSAHDIPVSVQHCSGQPRRVMELAGHPAVVAARAAADGAPDWRADSDGPAEPGDDDAYEESTARSPIARERAERLAELREEIVQLEQAIDSRPLIDQARGVLMATEACSAEDAWQILVETSQHANIKLRSVAAAIVASVTGPAPEPPLRAALKRAVTWHRVRRKRRETPPV